jgi:hypothetical protein
VIVLGPWTSLLNNETQPVSTLLVRQNQKPEILKVVIFTGKNPFSAEYIKQLRKDMPWFEIGF